jgi:hypothetical protein
MNQTRKPLRDAERAPKPVDMTLSALMDFDRNLQTFGGLLGQWNVEICNADGKRVGGMLAGWRQCLDHAKREGVSPLRIRYTDRARRAKPNR